MPKYAQTLTANSYNEIDFSNRLKEGFDNLGWGTGKVDILGGYRFTATDQANSITTPLSIPGSTFLENHQGKNIIRPSKSNSPFRPSQVLGLYLPGVKRFRLKYTLKSTSLPNGSEQTVDNINFQISAAYYPPNDRRYDTSSTDPTYGDSCVSTFLHTTNSKITVGTQYISPWIGNNDIVGLIGVSFRFNLNAYIEIDAVEYEVTQNKFAFQSPNLDSPTFESYTISLSGSLWSCVSTLPIKNSKTPLAKITPFHASTSANVDDTSSWEYFNPVSTVAMASKALFDCDTNRTERGYFLSLMNVDITAWGSYGKDTSIHIGSNTSFDGFYLLTRQDTMWNGTVWDTVNKASAFPNTSPQFPSTRSSITTALGSYNNGNTEEGTYSVEGGLSFDVFKVKNQTQLSAIQLRYSGRRTDYYTQPLNITTTAILYKAEQDQVSKKFKVTEKLQEVNLSNPKVAGNLIQSQPVNLTLQPGTYILASKNNQQVIHTAYRYISGGSFANVVSSTRNIEFLQSTTVAERNDPKYRYVRETLYGSTSNGGNHWIEIKVVNNLGVNVAAGKLPTTNAASSTNIQRVTDGNLDYSYYFEANSGEYVMIDLGEPTQIDNITTLHYWGDSRSYTTKLEVSTDGVTWVEIFAGTYREQDEYYNSGYQGKNFALKYYTDINITPGSTISIGPGNDPYAANLRAIPRGDKLVLVESGTATPTSTLSSFAENWVNFAWYGRSPQVPKVYGISGGYTTVTLGSTGSLWWKYTNFTFGLDSQLTTNSAGNVYLSTPLPGSVFSGRGAQTLQYNYPLVEEFVGAVPKMSDGRNYTRNKLSSIEGTTLECNNTFILFGDMNNKFNTSYTTLDGSEYVVVMTNGVNGSYPYGALAFELRP